MKPYVRELKFNPPLKATNIHVKLFDTFSVEILSWALRKVSPYAILFVALGDIKQFCVTSIFNSPVKTQTAHAAIREDIKSDVRYNTAIFYFVNINVPRVRLKFGVG